MNKPTVLAIVSAFEKVVKPGIGDGCSPSREDAYFNSLRLAFLCELEPLMKAHRAEATSRKVVIEGLKAAIAEFFEHLPELLNDVQHLENNLIIFKMKVFPWLDRLES